MRLIWRLSIPHSSWSGPDCLVFHQYRVSGALYRRAYHDDFHVQGCCAYGDRGGYPHASHACAEHDRRLVYATGYVSY